MNDVLILKHHRYKIWQNKLLDHERLMPMFGTDQWKNWFEKHCDMSDYSWYEFCLMFYMENKKASLVSDENDKVCNEGIVLCKAQINRLRNKYLHHQPTNTERQEKSLTN